MFFTKYLKGISTQTLRLFAATRRSTYVDIFFFKDQEFHKHICFKEQKLVFFRYYLHEPAGQTILDFYEF